MSFHDRLLDRKGRGKVDRPLRQERPALLGQRSSEVAGGWIGKPASQSKNSEAVPFPKTCYEKQVDPLSDPPFSVRSLAERWCCSESTVRNEISANRLGHFRIGGLIRVSAAEVARFECQE